MITLKRVTDDLVAALAPLRFGAPVTHVYNPLVYARAPHDRYLARAHRGVDAVLLGMNPGPFGMAQSGVPFGEIAHVRDWIGIEERVEKPEIEHPKRPILGFDCARSEVSGARLWGWAKASFETPERFFERFFIINYCPLVFMEESGRNCTPDKIARESRTELFAICDEALRRSVDALDPGIVIGIGNFAEARAREALEAGDVRVGKVLHPSPQSPAANRGWAEAASRQLSELGLEIPCTA